MTSAASVPVRDFIVTASSTVAAGAEQIAIGPAGLGNLVVAVVNKGFANFLASSGSNTVIHVRFVTDRMANRVVLRAKEVDKGAGAVVDRKATFVGEKVEE